MTLTGNNVITLRKLTSKVTAEKGILPLYYLEQLDGIRRRHMVIPPLVSFLPSPSPTLQHMQFVYA